MPPPLGESPCFDQVLLLRFVRGEVPSDRLEDIDRHLDECSSCRKLLGNILNGFERSERAAERDESMPSSDVLAPGAAIGRYLILDFLGGGAMGRVYAAYDPELDREVALKILREDKTSPDTEARLFGEAQAIARLAHPNVVAVYDVGMAAGRVFVAMELVVGSSLTQWLAERPRAPKEVLTIFVAAGQGLAAAHSAGLIHRDFKPDNVLVGVDGRVRVTDFGLACPSAAPGLDGSPSIGSCLSLASPLTQGKMLVGTPAYMSPEQLSGTQADARSDLFSFCVALYKALYRQSPFPADSVEELRQAIHLGRVRQSPVGVRAPKWILPILRRGMAADPAQRYASMQDLLAALTAGGKRFAARRTLVVTLFVAGIAALAGWQFQQYRARSCDAYRRLAGIWDEDRKNSVRQSFLGTGKTYAPDVWAAIERTLDQYAHRWDESRTGVCRALQAGRESPAVARLQAQCLQERLAELQLVGELLSQPDQGILIRAPAMASRLSPIGDCEDLIALGGRPRVSSDPAIRTKVDQLRGKILQARGHWWAGKPREAFEVAKRAVEEARETGYRPTLAEALAVQGLAEQEMGSLGAAEEKLKEAHRIAVEHGHDRVAAEAANVLVHILGTLEARYAEAHHWAEQSSAHIAHLGGDGHYDFLAAQLSANLGATLLGEATYSAAGQQLNRALELRERTYGKLHPLVAHTLNAIGVLEYELGHYSEAVSRMEQAVRIWRETHGPGHPEVLMAIANIGMVLLEQVKLKEAEAHLGPALASLQEALGGDHPWLIFPLRTLGALQTRLGQYQQARAHLEQALVISEKVFGGEHLKTATVLDEIGVWNLNQRKFAEAIALHRRALLIRERAQGMDHPAVAVTLDHLGNALTQAGRYQDASPVLERALRIARHQHGPEYPETGIFEHDYAMLLLAMGKPRAAISHFELALNVAEKNVSDDSPQIAERLTGLARAYLRADDFQAALPLLKRAARVASASSLSDRELGPWRLQLTRALHLARSKTSSLPSRPHRFLAERGP